jgi:uncharacterized membrane protein YccC
MVALSTRTKEAIKTALAMTIAYGVALQLGWEKPMWAGFAVAMVSLATVGQSLNKAALRMFGTLVAAVAALTIIALSPQDRWLFMMLLSAYVGFVTYMIGGSRHPYFWQVCGFVCVIISMAGGPDSVHAFQIAVMRLRENGLGILVYGLVTVFLWPLNSQADFEAAVCKLASTQRELFQACFGLMNGKDTAGQADQLKAEVIQAQAVVDPLLDAAETDSPEIAEQRDHWRQFQREMAALRQATERWDASLVGCQDLDWAQLLPQLDDFATELDERMAQIERMLANQALERRPAEVALVPDATRSRRLSRFDKAALVVIQDRLQQLDHLTRSLFDTVSDIRRLGPSRAGTEPAASLPISIVLDPDRILSVFRISVSLWLSYLLLIYVNDIPTGATFVILTGSLGIAVATMPQVPISVVVLPAGASIFFAGALHLFVMPHLSSFLGLGIMIFAATFTICYVFAAPNQRMGRVCGLAILIMITSITNQQTYSFLSIANTALMLALVLLILAATAYIPFSPHPERVFLRLLRRYFRAGEYLISVTRPDAGQPATYLDGWWKAFYMYELSVLPRKLGLWAGFINDKLLPGTNRAQVQAFAAKTQALTYRLQDLLETGSPPEVAALARDLQADIASWRDHLEGAFKNLSADPTVEQHDAYRDRLDGTMNRLEARIRQTVDHAAEKTVGTEDGIAVCRLLGAYRGVSEAVVAYAASAAQINWAPWREGRF